MLQRQFSLQGPGFCSMSPDSSSKEVMTEAATDRATSNVQFTRYNILKSSLLFVTKLPFWLNLRSMISTCLPINIRRRERILLMSGICITATV